MRLRAIFLFLLALLAPVACRDRSAPLESVRIGYFATLTHAQAVLGVASGELANAVLPARLEPVVFNAGPSFIEALFAGAVDVGYVGPGPALSACARSRCRAVRIVAGAAANGVVVVARRGTGARSICDLRGRRVATPQLGNTQDLSARHFLGTECGANLEDIVPVANAEQAAMLARGDIDAAWVPEPWGERLIAEAGAELVAEEKDLWPSREFTLTVVVTTPEFLATHRATVDKILEVHRAWTERLAAAPRSHVPALADALFDLTGKRLPAGVLGASLERVKFTGDISEESLRAFARYGFELDFERSRVEWSDLIDPSTRRASHVRE